MDLYLNSNSILSAPEARANAVIPLCLAVLDAFLTPRTRLCLFIFKTPFTRALLSIES